MARLFDNEKTPTVDIEGGPDGDPEDSALESYYKYTHSNRVKDAKKYVAMMKGLRKVYAKANKLADQGVKVFDADGNIDPSLSQEAQDLDREYSSAIKDWKDVVSPTTDEKSPFSSPNTAYDQYLNQRKSAKKVFEKSGQWPSYKPVEQSGSTPNPGNRDDLKVTGKGRGSVSEDRRTGGDVDDSQGSLTAEQKAGMLSDKDQAAYVQWVLKNPGKSTDDWKKAGSPGSVAVPGAGTAGGSVDTQGGDIDAPKPKGGGLQSDIYIDPGKIPPGVNSFIPPETTAERLRKLRGMGTA